MAVVVMRYQRWGVIYAAVDAGRILDEFESTYQAAPGDWAHIHRSYPREGLRFTRLDANGKPVAR